MLEILTYFYSEIFFHFGWTVPFCFGFWFIVKMVKMI